MPNSLKCRLKNLVRNGLLQERDLKRIIIIPPNATNGEVIKAVFPDIESRLDEKTEVMLVKWANGIMQCIKASWWNAPYKTGSGEV